MNRIESCFTRAVHALIIEICNPTMIQNLADIADIAADLRDHRIEGPIVAVMGAARVEGMEKSRNVTQKDRDLETRPLGSNSVFHMIVP